jgi:hypothetical protein
MFLMIELLRTNDPVILSYIQAVLGDADVPSFLLDSNMSIMDGSIGVLPRRLMINDDDAARVRGLLDDPVIAPHLNQEFRSRDGEGAQPNE